MKLSDLAHKNLRMKLQSYIRGNLNTPINRISDENTNFETLLSEYDSFNTDPKVVLKAFDKDKVYLESPHLIAFMHLYSVNTEIHVLDRLLFIFEKYLFYETEKLFV